MPAVITPEDFQTEQSLVALLAPELSGSFEPTLGLSASCFHRATANGFARPPSGPIIHARMMFMEVGHFFGHDLCRRSGRHLRQRLLELANDFDGRLVLQLLDQGFKPGAISLLVFAKERPSHRRQMLHGVIEVQSLSRLREPIISQPPDPHGPITNDQGPGSLT